MRVCLLRYLKGGVFALGLFIFQLIAVNYIYPWTMSNEALVYRENGYRAQNIGDIDSAITWYQKACELDSNYAIPHNDLGILYEAKGWLDRAEIEYQKALEIDPNYGKSCTNLALVYERKGELEKSAFYWMRRYKLGKSGDYWTDEARKRLEKLGLVEETARFDIVQDKSQESSGLKAAPESIAIPINIEPISQASTVPKEEFTRTETAKKDTTAKERKREEEIENLERKIETPIIKYEDFPIKTKDVQIATTAGITAQPEIQKAAAPEKVIEKIAPRVSMPVEAPKKKAKSKKRVTGKEFSPDAAVSKDLDAAIQLAETNLAKSERVFVGKTIDKPRGKEEEMPEAKFRSNSEARKYYIQARGYYKKGEYLKALDAIKAAKTYYPEDSAILALEKKIREKMR